MQKWTFIWKKMNSNIFRFDNFIEPVVVVSYTRKNYFNWALSDWAIKVDVCPLLIVLISKIIIIKFRIVELGFSQGISEYIIM